MINAHSHDKTSQIESCETWLRKNSGTRFIVNRARTSYDLKHRVEKEHHIYIPNDVFVEACRFVGIKVERAGSTKNFYADVWLDEDKPEGTIYFAQWKQGGPIKIGWSKNPQARLSSLNTSSPHEIVFVLQLQGWVEDEKRFHLMFAEDRLNGEWFNPSPWLTKFISEANKRKKMVAL